MQVTGSVQPGLEGAPTTGAFAALTAGAAAGDFAAALAFAVVDAAQVQTAPTTPDGATALQSGQAAVPAPGAQASGKPIQGAPPTGEELPADDPPPDGGVAENQQPGEEQPATDDAAANEDAGADEGTLPDAPDARPSQTASAPTQVVSAAAPPTEAIPAAGRPTPPRPEQATQRDRGEAVTAAIRTSVETSAVQMGAQEAAPAGSPAETAGPELQGAAPMASTSQVATPAPRSVTTLQQADESAPVVNEAGTGATERASLAARVETDAARPREATVAATVNATPQPATDRSAGQRAERPERAATQSRPTESAAPAAAARRGPGGAPTSLDTNARPAQAGSGARPEAAPQLVPVGASSQGDNQTNAPAILGAESVPEGAAPSPRPGQATGAPQTAATPQLVSAGADARADNQTNVPGTLGTEGAPARPGTSARPAQAESGAHTEAAQEAPGAVEPPRADALPSHEPVAGDNTIRITPQPTSPTPALTDRDPATAQDRAGAATMPTVPTVRGAEGSEQGASASRGAGAPAEMRVPDAAAEGGAAAQATYADERADEATAESSPPPAPGRGASADPQMAQRTAAARASYQALGAEGRPVMRTQLRQARVSETVANPAVPAPTVREAGGVLQGAGPLAGTEGVPNPLPGTMLDAEPAVTTAGQATMFRAAAPANERDGILPQQAANASRALPTTGASATVPAAGAQPAARAVQAPALPSQASADAAQTPDASPDDDPVRLLQTPASPAAETAARTAAALGTPVVREPGARRVATPAALAADALTVTRSTPATTAADLPAADGQRGALSQSLPAAPTVAGPQPEASDAHAPATMAVRAADTPGRSAGPRATAGDGGQPVAVAPPVARPVMDSTGESAPAAAGQSVRSAAGPAQVQPQIRALNATPGSAGPQGSSDAARAEAEAQASQTTAQRPRSTQSVGEAGPSHRLTEAPVPGAALVGATQAPGAVAVVTDGDGAARPAPAEVAQRVGELVRRVDVTGEGRLELQVDWADLGVERVVVEWRGDQARVDVSCRTEAAAAALRPAEPHLRERLAGLGVELSELRTSCDTGGRQRGDTGADAWVPAQRWRAYGAGPAATSQVAWSLPRAGGRRVDILA